MLALERTSSMKLTPVEFDSGATDYEIVQRAIAYVTEHFRDQPEVDAIARAVGTDARTLTELRDAALELEDCRVWACAAAVEATGVERAAVEARLAGVMSVPRFLREVDGAQLVVV